MRADSTSPVTLVSCGARARRASELATLGPIDCEYSDLTPLLYC